MSIILIGSGKHCNIIKDVLGDKNYLIFDDKIKGKSLLDFENYLLTLTNEIDIVLCIGNNEQRSIIYNKMKNMRNFNKLNFINVISKNSIISKNCKYGKGNHFLNGCIIETHTKIGDFNIFNTNSSVNHDCIIHNFCHLSPHTSLCGNCEIENGIIIPTGYNIIPNWKITSKKPYFRIPSI